MCFKEITIFFVSIYKFSDLTLLFFIPKVLYSGWLGLLIVVASFICGYICLHLSPIRKKTLGMIRILFLKSKNEKKFNDLVCQRSEIIKMYLDLN